MSTHQQIEIEKQILEQELADLREKIELLISRKRCELLPQVYAEHIEAYIKLRQEYKSKGILK